MCNVALVGLALMAAGTGVKYVGERQAAKKLRRVMDAEKSKQRGLRKKSLDEASAVIDKNDPKSLNESANVDVRAANTEGDRATSLVKSIATAAPTSAAGDITGAARDATRSARNTAKAGGVSAGLRDRMQLLKRLMHSNGLINEDSRRSLATLDSRMADAGNSGAGLRLLGSLLGMGGQAATSNSAWGPALQTTTAGLEGFNSQPMDGVDHPRLYRRSDPTRAQV